MCSELDNVTPALGIRAESTFYQLICFLNEIGFSGENNYNC